MFFEKWNLLVSTPKWKNKVTLSLQLALDLLKEFDEAFVIETIEQAIQSDWSVFKGIEVKEMYQKWQKLQKPPKTEKKTASKRFKPPTLDEVKIYCVERKNKVDPQKFINHYDSNGWMVGRTKMKDWKAAVRTWEGSNFEKTSTEKQEIKVLTSEYPIDHSEASRKIQESIKKEEQLKNSGRPLINKDTIPDEIMREISEKELEEIRERLKNLGNETESDKKSK